MATIEERFGMIERSVLEQAGAEAQKLLDQAWEYKDTAMKKAEEQAAVRREEILAQAAKDCAKLKSDAEKRMDKAAQAILGRVVES